MGRPDDMYCIDWNDAVFESLLVRSRGTVVIMFSQMCFYFYASPHRDSVMKKEYRAAVVLQEVKSLEFMQPVGDRDLVYEGTILGRNGESLELSSTLDVVPIRELAINFLSGCRIQVKCSRVRLDVDLASEPVVADLQPRPIGSRPE